MDANSQEYTIKEDNCGLAVSVMSRRATINWKMMKDDAENDLNRKIR